MAELTPWSEPLQDEWIDYNGHLSEAYYVLVMGHATDSVMAQLGMTPDYLERTATSLYTLEAHVRYLDQVSAPAQLEVRSRIIGAAPKLVWLWHELWSDGRVRATEEVLMVHVDTTAGRASAMPPALASRVEGLLVEPPEDASRSIALRRR